MSIENYELQLEETRKIINWSRANFTFFKQQILESHLKFLKNLLEGENNTDKMFSLLFAIRGIEEYLEE